MKINLKIMRPVGFHKSININLKKTIKRVERGSGWKVILSCLVYGSKLSYTTLSHDLFISAKF